jgi:hypothetical protein
VSRWIKRSWADRDSSSLISANILLPDTNEIIDDDWKKGAFAVLIIFMNPNNTL